MSVVAWVLAVILSVLILVVTGVVGAVGIYLELTVDEQAERTSH